MQKAFRRSWGWYQVPVHLFHYSPTALEKVCRRTGFEVDKIGFRGGDSLLILLSLVYATRGASAAASRETTAVQRALISLASLVLRPYYYLGSEEILGVLRTPGGGVGSIDGRHGPEVGPTRGSVLE